ncbi:hypothetical protein ACWEWI_04540 [Streptomyces sp. NPDC003753]
MTSAAERPVLFVDVAVDGRLIPFGSPSSRLQAPASDSEASLDQGDPLLTVWASTWTKEANEAVAPRIGLPRLPVVEWPDACADDSPLSATGATAMWRVSQAGGVLLVETLRKTGLDQAEVEKILACSSTTSPT